MTTYPAVKPIKQHVIAATGQYHGCPTCDKTTWHHRKTERGVTVLVCSECGREA